MENSTGGQLVLKKLQQTKRDIQKNYSSKSVKTDQSLFTGAGTGTTTRAVITKYVFFSVLV